MIADCERRTVRLKVLESVSSAISGELTLELEQMLRYLKGRREVWQAGDASESSAYVAKCFLAGEKQQREFDSERSGLMQLQQRCIACPQLLCTATDAQGGLWVVTPLIRKAKDLSDLVLQADAEAELKRATRQFADVLCAHWQAGVHQTDAHLRNFLWDGETLYTIDVGSIRFYDAPLSRSKRISILQTMLGGYIESFRCALLQAFVQVCQERGDTEFAEQIQRASFAEGIHREEAKDLWRVWRKSRRECTQFRRETDGQHLLIFQRDLEPSLVDCLRQAPDSLLDMGQRLKSGNTCTVQKIDWASRPVVVKRYNAKSVFYRIRHFFYMSRAMRSWSNGIVLQQLGIPTTTPLAVVEERSAGMFKRGYFLMEHFDGGSIYDYLNTHEGDAVRFDRAIERLAQLFERLKQLRIIHGDLKAKNLLINDSELKLIDTDGMRFLVSRSRFTKSFQADYKRFLSNWPAGAPVRERLKNRLSGIFHQ